MSASKDIVKRIREPIADEMEHFEEKFKASMSTQTPMLNRITQYIVKRKGKQIRPMFVFHSAKMFGEVTEASYTAASLVELLHTATLVHDDVVDDANERRGFFSVNALWKNKIAVLVGDYLLSRGLLMSVDEQAFDLLKIVSDAVRQMSEGELLQIEKARKLNITEEIYYEVIRQKTASLVAACCAAGTSAANQDEATIDKMKSFGEKVGMAFQIKDDIFDYGTPDKIGKPTGIDIKEQKLTLPVIYTLKNANDKDQKRLRKIIKRHNDNNKKVREAVKIVIDNGGIHYADKQLRTYSNEAIELLHTFPESASRKALEELVDYTINREK